MVQKLFFFSCLLIVATIAPPCKCIAMTKNIESYTTVKKAIEPRNLSIEEATVIAKDVADWLSKEYPANLTTISLFRKYGLAGIEIEKNLRKKGFGILLNDYSEKNVPISYSIYRIDCDKIVILELKNGTKSSLNIAYKKTKNGLRKIAPPTVMEEDA